MTKDLDLHPVRHAQERVCARAGAARGAIAVGVVALALLAAGCSQSGVKGQVIATVNGQEITPQDLQAEARSNPVLTGADSSVLLQRVIARTLLAQAAHKQGLDSYAGYPSDIARLKQDFLAQRMARASLKPPAAPTSADLDKVMAANPYSFAQREDITIDDLTMQPPAASLTSLESLKNPTDVIARLTQLSIPYHRRTMTLDTAKVPAALAARLSTAPIGQMFFVRNDSQLAAMTVTQRAPLATPPEDAAANATQLFQSENVQQQIGALVGRLRAEAKVVYGNGFVPPKGAEGPATANAVGQNPAAAH